MRIIETKVYKFEELTEEAKQKAVENLYDINVAFDWWDCTYDDALDIGLNITGFDIDRASYVNATFTDDACFTAHKIIDNHGDKSETYASASVFLANRDTIINGADRDEYGEVIDEYKLNEELDEIESEFLKTLREDYRITLSKEYEYLTSEEAIIETIKANEYEFTAEGKLI